MHTETHTAHQCSGEQWCYQQSKTFGGNSRNNAVLFSQVPSSLLRTTACSKPACVDMYTHVILHQSSPEPSCSHCSSQYEVIPSTLL